MSAQENYNEWCRKLMHSLAVGGVWTVPRSGLVFTKTDEDTLTLTEKLPAPMMVRGEGNFAAYQDEDFNVIRDQFEAAGFKVKP